MKSGLQILLHYALAISIVLLGVSPELFHEHEHHEKLCDETHDDNTVDACHLRLFHDGNVSECQDHLHLTEDGDECSFCQLTIPNYTVLKIAEETNQKTTINSSIEFGDLNPNKLLNCLLHDKVRGPPSAFS